MSVTKGNQYGEAVGPMLSLDGAVSTGTGTAFVLKRPLSQWSLGTLVSGATEGTIVLEGSAFSSSDAPFSTIMSVTASTDGETNSTGTFPAIQVRATLNAVSSSDGLFYATINGAP